MDQIKKIYLASFLKNQTYFVPIIIIFFQNLGLSYSEIFWIFTIGSVFSFLIEIPTGIFADLYGKRKSIIFSKFIIFLAFVAFGLSFNFLTLLAANLLYELGKSFRSGSETAYVYDYLAGHEDSPSYTTVKANQKFYARLSESIGTAVGGLIAVRFGFNWAFLIAAIPAFINYLQTLTWDRIKENGEKFSLVGRFKFAGDSFREIYRQKVLLRIIINIILFSSVFFALDKFIQPYMVEAGVPLELFGFIYSGFLLLVAFVVRYVSKLEDKFGGMAVVNYLTLISFLPLLILGLGYSSIIGIILFFFVLMVANIRSPIENSVFHEHVGSKNRATMGSILELFKSSAKLIVLPITGYLADFYSMRFAILILCFVILFNGTIFWLVKKK
ncbi:hypothetical protein COT97_05320 [Candidatus Falkowbacteria bacterium CG10_big_fil_rev_8_21_14_0_10_39_11]|uniref:Major facilitator superfamily (MFS) profile domain-containing protein n=1 Tax=Candidatus Falkowbacteria bacterium CG10_big_fil_rev_8_21_14_0_10_39_11 TaxID=1974565 RepID=A0A2H0V3L2_9BACT|nr:MAG: hypothetical protein COT97_05320 [Candidatus Falkowbacteria bacterium CG10_big_fil_rev_8_21_14_0_10_39_11]